MKVAPYLLYFFFYLRQVYIQQQRKSQSSCMFLHVSTTSHRTLPLNQYVAGLEATPLFSGRGEEKSGSSSLEATSISTAGNAAGAAALCSTRLPTSTKLTATKMSVYCSEQDKPTDGPLHSNRSRGEPVSKRQRAG